MSRDTRPTKSSNKSTPARTRGGCESCRRRHTKCDDKRPSCASCEHLQIRCERQEGLIFRHMTRVRPVVATPERTFAFSSDQRWIDVPRKLYFVDATSRAGSDTGSEFDLTARSDTPEPAPVEARGSIGDDYADYATPPERTINSSPGRELGPTAVSSVEEASLFRHFVTNMSSWFDINDWNRTCTRELVKRSSSCRLILKAIYALASRQLANQRQLGAEKAQRYHDECLEELIPQLTDSEVLMDDNMFAATVMLRTKEEMEAYFVDREIYLLGIKAFTNSEQFDQQHNTFREAMYWVALRQDIHCALARQRPLDVNLNVSFLEHVTDLTTEVSWTKCCILNLAKILMFCFDKTRKTTDEWEALWAFTELLSRTLPSEYQPFYYTNEAKERTTPFPQVWLLSDTAVHSVQYLTFSKLLLSCFNPVIPRIGLGSHSSAQRNHENIYEYLRYLCGIGLSNPAFGPGMFLTCLGISLSGDRITDEAERECILEILSETQTNHGWQSSSIRRGLLEAWGKDTESHFFSDSPSTAIPGSRGS